MELREPTKLDHYVREAELRKLVPISHSTIWRLVQDGEFPAPIKISERVTVWKWADVEAWLDARRAKASPGAAA